MNRIPPTPEIIDAAKHILTPAACIAVGVWFVLTFISWLISKKFELNWRRAVPAISVLAITASIISVNYFRDLPFPWQPDGKWWHFGGWAIAGCLIVEFVASVIPSKTFGFLIRGAFAGMMTHFIVPAAWQAECMWWIPFVAMWLATAWFIDAELSLKHPGGATTLAMSIFAGGTGIVLLHAKSLGFSDLATATAVGLFLLAVLSKITKSNVGSAAAAAVTPVLILLWLNRPLADSEVPVWCHRILAAAPILTGIMLLPPLNRSLGTRKGGLIILGLIVIPVIVAVSMAVVTAPMTFDEEKW